MTTIREELDCLAADLEIMETVLFMQAFGKVLTGVELEQSPEGRAMIRFDKGAQA